MTRSSSTNYTASGTNFEKATAATDAWKKEDLQRLAEAVDGHDHRDTRGLGVKRVQTSETPSAAGHVQQTGDMLKWWAQTAGAVKTAVDTDSVQTLTNKIFDATGNVPIVLASTVLANAAASIIVGDIPATYGHLLGLYSVRSAKAAAGDTLMLRLNADSGNNYYHQYAGFVAAASDISESTTGTGYAYIGGPPAASATAKLFLAGLVFIPSYASTDVLKTGWSLSHSVSSFATGKLALEFDGFTWNSASAITSLTFAAEGGNLAAGSRITVLALGT